MKIVGVFSVMVQVLHVPLPCFSSCSLSLALSASAASRDNLLCLLHLARVTAESTVLVVAISLRCSWRFLRAALASFVVAAKSLPPIFGAGLVGSFTSFLIAAASGLFVGGVLLL